MHRTALQTFVDVHGMFLTAIVGFLLLSLQNAVLNTEAAPNSFGNEQPFQDERKCIVFSFMNKTKTDVAKENVTIINSFCNTDANMHSVNTIELHKLLLIFEAKYLDILLGQRKKHLYFVFDPESRKWCFVELLFKPVEKQPGTSSMTMKSKRILQPFHECLLHVDARLCDNVTISDFLYCKENEENLCYNSLIVEVGQKFTSSQKQYYNLTFCFMPSPKNCSFPLNDSVFPDVGLKHPSIYMIRICSPFHLKKIISVLKQNLKYPKDYSAMVQQNHRRKREAEATSTKPAPQTAVKFEWFPKFNESAYRLFLEKEELKLKIHNEAEWAYLCVVFLLALIVMSIWCMRGFYSRNTNKRRWNYNERAHFLTVKEVLYQKAAYLPMFNRQGPLDEVMVHDCGTDPDPTMQ